MAKKQLEIRTEGLFKRMTRKTMLPLAFIASIAAPAVGSSGCGLLMSIKGAGYESQKQCPTYQKPVNVNSPNPYAPGSACWRAFDDERRTMRAYRYKY